MNLFSSGAQHRRKRKNPAPQGFTLVEVGIAAVLVAMIGSGVLMFIADELRTSEAQSAGTSLATLNSAVSAYEAQFAANLASHTTIPIPGYANVANPYAPTVTELTELGFLKTPVPLGVYGISINSTVTNGLPSGMVWRIAPFLDNLGRPSQDLAAAAMISAGGDAAFSTTASPSIVTGADGWNATNPQANTAAIVAMRNGSGSAAYLRLDGSTPMQGSLNVNNNNITNANAVSAANVTTGSLSSGSISTGNLTASGAISAGGNITGANLGASGNVSGSTLTATAMGNDVYFGSSALYSDGWNTVIRNTGGALYVQNFSGAALPIVTSQVVTPAGNGVQVGSSYFYGDGSNSAVRQNGTLYVQNQAGSGAANLDANWLTAEGYVQTNGYASAGAGCGPNGLMARDASGPLFCVNGVWTSPNSGGAQGTWCGYLVSYMTQSSEYGSITASVPCQGVPLATGSFNGYINCPGGYTGRTVTTMYGSTGHDGMTSTTTQIFACVAN